MPFASKKKHCNGAVNGIIPSTVRLSIHFIILPVEVPTGIFLTHGGVSHMEVFTSVWRDFDAINKCNQLA